MQVSTRYLTYYLYVDCCTIPCPVEPNRNTVNINHEHNGNPQ